MKRTIQYLLLAAFAAVSASGCGKEGGSAEFPEGSGPVAGQWHMVSWNSISGGQADVYISFDEDGTFDLYQRVYTVYYEHYDGTYTQDGAQVDGTYSDGTPWGCSYTARFPEDRSRMTLTPSDGSGDSVYEAVQIPDEILSGLLSGSKAGDDGNSGFRFL